MKYCSDNAKIMVHCNAGALATSGIGTALGILYTAKNQGKKITVYSCETRPLLQGARLTSWELTANNIKTYTICDNMAATYMPDMNLVLVGADRIASNGDTANKIGTKGLAIIAQYYNVPFYVAAPLSTFDLDIKSGDDIPIEIRCDDEVRKFNKIVAEKAKICNPAFDVTPSSLITRIITEKGIIKPPYNNNIRRIK
jgi:methylthioribose-1-phosphate isomerase